MSAVVLEARDRVGGRVLNAPIGDDTVVELGGQWVGPGHDRIVALAAELGIATFPTYDKGDNLVLSSGRVSRFRGNLPRHDRRGALDLLQAKFRLQRMARSLDGATPWLTDEYSRWDGDTPARWISRHMHTKTGRAVMRMFVEAILAADPAEVSLLHLVLYIRAAGCSLDALTGTSNGAQQDRFVGGSQRIALAIAALLGDHVRLEAAVSSITQTQDGVLVQTADGQAVDARFVVVAIPPAVVPTIGFTPPLPGERMQFVQRVAPGTVIKYLAVYDRPFWRERGLSGIAYATEGPVKAVYDNSPPDGLPGVLLGFALAREARALARLSSERRRASVLERFGTLFGADALHPRQFLEQDWAAQPWTRGGYAGSFGPGGLSAFGGGFRRPTGRIHWAGSEMAHGWAGSMDGAVRAGERTAADVLSRLAPDGETAPPVGAVT